MGEDRTWRHRRGHTDPIRCAMYLSLPVTLALFIGLVCLFFIARWQGGQPARPERGPRMIPWTLIAILAAGLAVILLAHLASFAGFDFSQRPGRF